MLSFINKRKAMKDFMLFVENRDSFAVGLFRQFKIEETPSRVLIITPNVEYKRWVLEYIKSRLQDYHKEILVKSHDEVNQKEPEDGLLSRYTFENFVVGKSNEVVYRICKEVASNPGGSYSPVFIYGGVGLGKSHLLHATGNLAKRKGFAPLYISANDFSALVIKSIREGKLEEFHSRFKNLDLLLIDDVQFLSGKERTQMELFRVFEAMHAREKQIVLVSDRHPKDIRDISERLLSRFASGIIIEIGLDEETRLFIIKQKLYQFGIEPSEELVSYVADNTGYNIREIEGFIKTIKVTGIKRAPKPSSKLEEELLKLVARSFNLKPEDLKRETKERKVINARQLAMYFCKTLLGMTYLEVSRLFGRSDHTFALYSIKKVEEKRQKDKRYELMLMTLEKNIRRHLNLNQ